MRVKPHFGTFSKLSFSVSFSDLRDSTSPKANRNFSRKLSCVVASVILLGNVGVANNLSTPLNDEIILLMINRTESFQIFHLPSNVDL